ncbi:hypothetical protein ACNIUV_28650, partial [Escherichia coli]
LFIAGSLRLFPLTSGVAANAIYNFFTGTFGSAVHVLFLLGFGVFIYFLGVYFFVLLVAVVCLV